MNTKNMSAISSFFVLGCMIYSLTYGHKSEVSKRSGTRTIADFIVKTDESPAVGPPGPPGPRGIPGTNGAIGAQGIIGMPGQIGQVGAQGATGATGATGAAGNLGMNNKRNTENGWRDSLVTEGPIFNRTTGHPGTDPCEGSRRKRDTRESETDDVEYCTITWKNSKFSNTKSSFKSLTRTDVSQCFDECLRAIECVSVDVQCPSSSSCVCYLHNKPDDIDDLNIVQGITSYRKDALCSKISPARGPRGPPGPPGPPGKPGPTGMAGVIGSTGPSGDTGYTGSIGMTGQQGRSARKRSLQRVLKRSNSDSERTDYCVMSWKKLENIAFKGSYRNIVEQSLMRCLYQCKTSPGCLAVEVQPDSVTESDITSYSCWLHNSSQDEEDSSNGGGKTPYIRQLACSRTMPAIGPMGPPGPSGFPGQSGETGGTGATGMTGLKGRTGIFGQQGATGASGPTRA